MEGGEIAIRHAEPKDHGGIAALLAELGYPASAEQVAARISNERSNGQGSIYVAESDGRLVGLASFQRIPLLHADGFLGRITSLVVASHSRRRGVGQRLVQAVEELAWQRGCRRLEVTSGDQRADAHSFYLARGFIADSRRFVKPRPVTLP